MNIYFFIKKLKTLMIILLYPKDEFQVSYKTF